MEGKITGILEKIDQKEKNHYLTVDGTNFAAYGKFEGAKEGNKIELDGYMNGTYQNYKNLKVLDASQTELPEKKSTPCLTCKVEILQGVTLEDFQNVYNTFGEVNSIVATNLFPLVYVADETRKYDVVIYYK